MLKVDVLRKEKTFYTKNVIPYFIERWQNYEIDDRYDFLCVESILSERLREKM
jgi:CMP-N-acetylneuraminic acid synthetase